MNIGTNRWSFKPEIGLSKTFGPVTLELVPSVTFFTDNDDFLGRHGSSKDPLYAVQGHAIYHTRFGLWAAFDVTYYRGGRHGRRRGGEPPENAPRRRTLAIPVTGTTRSSSTGARAPSPEPGVISPPPGSPGSFAGVGGSREVAHTSSVGWQREPIP